jgi:hypothetical protein
MEEYDFLPFNFIPLRIAFFCCLHKYLFKIYLMAVVVWKLFEATA